jgi:hypothetical protein
MDHHHGDTKPPAWLLYAAIILTNPEQTVMGDAHMEGTEIGQDERTPIAQRRAADE